MKTIVDEITSALRLLDPLELSSINAWALFDDIQFDSNDYDIVGPKARTRIDQILVELGFERNSGSHFSKDYFNVYIPKGSRRLGADLTGTIPKTDSKNWAMLTPSQALALAIKMERADQEFVERLAGHHMINLDKIQEFCRENGFASWWNGQREGLAQHQIEAKRRPKRTGRF